MKRYPEYKDSGIEWLGEIPSAWVKGRLRYYSTAKRGSGYQYLNEVDDDYNGRTEKVVRISDISEFNPILCKYQEQFENYRIEPDNILIGGTGHYFGKSIFVTNEMEGLIHSYNIIRIIIKKQISKYVQYWLSSIKIREQMDISVLGSGQPFIDIEGLKNLEILIPPLSEQTAIANFLDQKTQQIDDLIERKKRLIELLKEERTAVINQAVTKGLDPNVPMKDSGIEWLGEIPKHWETRRLATMGRFSKGRGISRDEIVDDGIPCIRYGEIYTQYDRIVRHPISRITEESSKKSEKIQKGDVLFTASGETIEEIGKSLVYYGDQDIYVGGDIIILKLYPNISALFMSFSLESNYIIQQKASYGKGGIIVHIYAKQLREIFVPIPPIIEQMEIVGFLEMRTNQIDEQIRLLKDEIELFTEYKTSLINEAVTGKIDVREYHIKEIAS